MRKILLILFSFYYQLPYSWCDLNSIKTYESNKLEVSNLKNAWQLNTSQGEALNTSHDKFNVQTQANEENETDVHLIPKLALKERLPHLNKHIWTIGKAKLKRIVHITNKYLNLTMTGMLILDEIVMQYNEKLQEYYDAMSEINVEHNIEYDMILLDAIEACNLIFSTTVSTLLSDISETNDDDVQRYKHVVKLFHKTVEDEKKDNLIYICRMFSVCRHYPAFSDHVADLLTELLIYSESDVINFLNVLKEVIVKNSDYLKTIVDFDTARIIASKLQSSGHQSFPITKYLIVAFTSMIRNRYKLHHSLGNSLYITNYTKAFELLIYVIDETIQELVGDNQVSTEFNNLKININAWARQQRLDLFKIHKHFWQKIIRNLKRRWNQKYGEEIKALIEILVLGQAKNIEIGNMLLTEGLKVNIRFSNNGFK